MVKTIYKLQLTDWGYDEYDSWVVIADNEDEVKQLCDIHKTKPDRYTHYGEENRYEDNIEYIKVIGTAVDGAKSSIVLSSFNAG